MPKTAGLTTTDSNMDSRDKRKQTKNSTKLKVKYTYLILMYSVLYIKK